MKEQEKYESASAALEQAESAHQNSRAYHERVLYELSATNSRVTWARTVANDLANLRLDLQASVAESRKVEASLVMARQDFQDVSADFYIARSKGKLDSAARVAAFAKVQELDAQVRKFRREQNTLHAETQRLSAEPTPEQALADFTEAKAAEKAAQLARTQAYNFLVAANDAADAAFDAFQAAEAARIKAMTDEEFTAFKQAAV